MRNYIVILCFFFYSCSGGSKKSLTTMPMPNSNERVATFGGGCFWAMEECMSEIKGVNRVISGYAGGKSVDPTYSQVVDGFTGHAEVVQVYYNPDSVSFKDLTKAFFFAHDPTEYNRQGPDVGRNYRSIAFYRTDEERTILIASIKDVNSSKHYIKPVVTEVEPFNVVYVAEDIHQGYYKLHPGNMYIVNVSKPKVMKLRKALPEMMKDNYKQN